MAMIAPVRRARRRNFSIARMEARYAPIFLLPAFGLLALFQFYPMISGLILSAYDWNGFAERVFVGLGNYREAFYDANLRQALWNTLYYVLGSMPVSLALSMLFAALMNMKMRGTTFFRAVYYLPAITSGVAIAMIWRSIFNTDFGLLNTTLYRMGFKAMIPWLNSSAYSMPALIIMSVWKGLGPNIIMTLAGLQSVPYTLYESADIDGAGAWAQFIHITMPMVSPTIFLMLVMNTISSFQIFDTVAAMTKGGPGNSTLVVVYYIYRVAFDNFRMGYASAMAFMLFAIILAITGVQWVVKRKWVYSETE
ncbi:MAG: sugar ABC transporter permease [Clostridiales bacterium]|nr:sugar ABC transporter permease [Clostridiales bacterium]